MILAIIAKIGDRRRGAHVIEYAGSAIRAMSMEERMTVCNMSIEAGARAGMIAPDDTTFSYLDGRPFAPKGARVGRALAILADAAVAMRTRHSTARSSSKPATSRRW